MAEGGVVLLFDENMPQRLARALRQELGENAFHVCDVLDRGTPDEAVLRHAGERGWCYLGSDRKILKRPHERAVIAQLGMGTFFLNDTIQGSCKIISTVVRHWPALKRLAQTQPRPFLYLVRETRVLPLRRRHLGSS
ncbi:DUF5615 family PIN-like protein [Longimicrobium sp.]|uniref:DUF5615 family PIN-like protein n=1 Tax=Longimicrobium sp. TaxID=2029185 RepID=UPI002B898882|nr:DUF5615 family PIN-like protein [Longimicrobium sp.]HSU17809.1 DUF5615 family PIN-like protein [Longimicrobium sp.]